MIDEASQALVTELLAAYAPFVKSRAEVLGVDVTEAVEEGTIWLGDELTAELSRPYGQQRRGPLEIFQAAMLFPTEAMVEAGAPEPVRDPMAMQALPGDRFGLAPVSSRDISEDVWSAHLVWGVTKARALRDLRGLEGT